MQIGSVMFITSVVKILILEYSFSLPPWIKRTSLSEKEKWNDKALTRFTNKKKQMVILELWLKLFAEHSLTEDIWKIFPSSYIQNFPCKKWGYDWNYPSQPQSYISWDHSLLILNKSKVRTVSDWLSFD